MMTWDFVDIVGLIDFLLFVQSTPIGSLQTAHEVISPHREQRNHPNTAHNNPSRPAKVSQWSWLQFEQPSRDPLSTRIFFFFFLRVADG